MSSQFPEARPRRLRRTPQLRSLFQESEFSLNDLVLPIFVEEEIDDFVPITSMPGVRRIPESKLAGEIERYARAGIKSVMTFGVSHHLDGHGSDTWQENGLVSRMARICKDAVPEMIVMSDTCFCEYTSHGHCGVLHDHGVDNDATLANLGKQAVVAAAAGADFIAPSAAMDGQVQAIRGALKGGYLDILITDRQHPWQRRGGRQRLRAPHSGNAAAVMQVLDSDQEKAASIFSNPRQALEIRGVCQVPGQLPTSLSTAAVDTWRAPEPTPSRAAPGGFGRAP